MDEFIENLKKTRGKAPSPTEKRPIDRSSEKGLSSKPRRPIQKRPSAAAKSEQSHSRKPNRVSPVESTETVQHASKASQKRRKATGQPPVRKKRRKLTQKELERLKKKEQRDQIIEIVKFALPVVIMAVIVFVFIFNTSPHLVDGDSMNPTLKSGEKVIAKRTKTPDRYEIITFDPPVEDSEFKYVKRVIGMPGDAIWIEGSDLFINQTEGLPDDVTVESATELPDGTIKVSISPEAVVQLSKFNKIPDDFYFVLGDNRSNSSDSREFGLVNQQSIEGVVTFRYKPLSSMGWIR